MIILLIVFSYAQAQTRLDPHGFKDWNLYSKSPRTEKACLVCHVAGVSRWKVQLDVTDRCTDCHNKNNHSGIKEHWNKEHQNNKIDCFSCHRPHRALLNGEKEIQTYFDKSYFNVGTHHQLNSKVHYERSSAPMLKRTCQDCHGATLK